MGAFSRPLLAALGWAMQGGRGRSAKGFTSRRAMRHAGGREAEWFAKSGFGWVL
jgi:hypothetical protein